MRKKFFLLIIVCLVMGAGVMAQTSTVSGTVFAEDNNEPIIGASVLVKGTTLGAVTDIEGKFTILNVPGTAKTVSTMMVPPSWKPKVIPREVTTGIMAFFIACFQIIRRSLAPLARAVRM